MEKIVSRERWRDGKGMEGGKGLGGMERWRGGGVEGWEGGRIEGGGGIERGREMERWKGKRKRVE